MLTINFNEINGIALIEPTEKLSAFDLQSAAEVIDPYIEKAGKLNGLIIHVPAFPGWDSFSAMKTHLTFVREHHKKIRFIALATDSPVAGIAEHISSRFISAKVKSFSFDDLEKAKQWIKDCSDE